MNDNNPQYYILVDYDNLEKNQNLQDNDIITAVNHMLCRLDLQLDFFAEAKALQRVNILLYGGWYDKICRTKKSTRIKQEISKQGSSLYLSRHNVNLSPYIDISHGLMSFPGRIFYGTFRHTQAEFKIKNLQSCCEDGEICIDFIKHLKGAVAKPHRFVAALFLYRYEFLSSSFLPVVFFFISFSKLAFFGVSGSSPSGAIQ